MRARFLFALLAAAAIWVQTVPATAALPAQVRKIMAKPRYADARWSLLAVDLKTGKTRYALHPDQLSFTGSTRKLFSVAVAFGALGADGRETTSVVRRGRLDADGTLHGGLVLVGGGDLTLGGRLGADGVQYTDLDHNDANALGDAELTPQDPLAGLDRLARAVRASGVRTLSGDVAIDDRLFRPYRVPNGNLLITPIMVNENMVDVRLRPGAAPGAIAALTYRPATAALSIGSTATTSAAGRPAAIDLSTGGRIGCIGEPGCTATISGTLPVGYRAPLTGLPQLIRTFRVENPAAFARTAFIEALGRAGVDVVAPPVGPNPRVLLSRSRSYPADARLAALRSAPYAELARLVLKVSLNLGANLSLSLFGLKHGARTVDRALAAERRVLASRFEVDPRLFDFPTNGSGSPDSEAAPRAIVQLLLAVARKPFAHSYRAALPILGRDGSLAHTGTTLPARGHVLAKTGTTILPSPDGEGIELKAQNLAGYITTKHGERLAFALMVNDVGAVENVEKDVAGVFEDQARITNLIYEEAD